MVSHRDTTQGSHRKSRQPSQQRERKESNYRPRATSQTPAPQAFSPYQTVDEDVLMSGSYADDLEHYPSLDSPSSSKHCSLAIDIDTDTDFDTTSFQHVSTAGNTSSYVLLHNRTYSNKSNQTSGESSDARCYSTPSQASGDMEWIIGAEFAVDTDVLGNEYMPHQWKGILPDMYSPEPRQVHNPYQQAGVSSGCAEVEYQEALENYSIQSASPQSTFVISPSASNFNGSEPPWDPIGDPYRVPRFTPGFAAFAPSPGPAGEQDQVPQDMHNRVEHTSESPQLSRSLALATRTRASGRTPSKGKGRAEPGWEHTVIQNDGLTRISELSSNDSSQEKYGRRKGKLDAKTAEKARKVRKVGACWPCWVLKVPCSEGEMCQRCRKRLASSPAADQLCCRSGFKDYEEAFFPGFLHSHFEKRKIEGLVTEHAKCWTDRTLKVGVTTGADFKPLKLDVNVFVPATNELLETHQLTTEVEERASSLLRRYSAPVGLMCVSPSELKRACRQHIEEMIEVEEYPAQTTAGDLSPIPVIILEVMRQYCAAKGEVQLIRSANMLHAIHYFMSHSLTFTEESASKVYQNVQPFGAPQEAYLSSRLLSRQVKYAMHKLHREITVEVLEGLEKSMRSRTRDSWGPSFCAILVLCLCIEGLQIAADTFIVYDWEKCEEEGIESQYRRSQSAEACQALEDYPFQQCTRLFHDIYRSHKEGNGGERKEGFNPLRALHEEGVTKGLDQATDRMARSINSIIYQCPELSALSNRDALVNLPYAAQSSDVKAHNTGRLTAKFLLSFFNSKS